MVLHTLMEQQGGVVLILVINWVIVLRGNQSDEGEYASRLYSPNNLKGVIIMNITGILEIGNGEKCPFCNLIVTEEIDFIDHAATLHKEKLNKILFGEEE